MHFAAFIGLSRLMPTAQSILTQAIIRAGSSFGEGELAYLALTSKVERPFLDRVASALHQNAGVSRWLVAREYHVRAAGRADIAILHGTDVVGIVEGKAMMVADCVRPEPIRRQYADAMQRDLDRFLAASLPHAAAYCLLLGVHPTERVPAGLKVAIKYSRPINRAFGKFASAAAIFLEADRHLRSYLREDVELQAGWVDAGEAFGVPVEVRWWLFGPFGSSHGLRILRG